MEEDSPPPSVNKMEFVNQGSIEMYQTKDSSFTPPNKLERTSYQLERLTPEVVYYCESRNDSSCDVMRDGEESMSSDELYQRIYQLTDTIEREISHSSNSAIINSTISDSNTQHKVTATSEPGLVSDNGKKREGGRETNDMENKIKKALGKMKRLDNKLAELTKREKEIKKQRKLMDEYHQSDQGSTLDDHISDGNVPVFSTQPQFKDDIQIECLESDAITTASETSTVNSKNTLHSKKRISDSNDSRQTDDFIARNKELAGQASQVIAMTEGERKHLESLLKEDEEEGGEGEGEKGFVFNETDLNRLATIDSELDRLVPILNSRATSTISTEQEESVVNSGFKSSYHQPYQPGERVLLVLQEDRSEHMRLAEIDKQLENINKNEEEPVSITEAQIQYLVEQSILEQQQQAQDTTYHQTHIDCT